MEETKGKFFKRPNKISRLISALIFGNSSSTKEVIKLINSLNKNQRVLFIGSAEKTFIANIVLQKDLNYFGLDIYRTKYVTHIGDAHKMEFTDNFFDLIIIQSVLEHLEKPQKCVKEIYRILKDGGHIYSEAPFMQEVHEPGSDYIRFSPEAHILLFKNFKVKSLEITKGIGYNLLWTIRYFISSFIGNKKIAGLLCIPFFWLRYLENIIPNKKFQWDACLETALLAKKIKPVKDFKILQKAYLVDRIKYKRIEFY